MGPVPPLDKDSVGRGGDAEAPQGRLSVVYDTGTPGGASRSWVLEGAGLRRARRVAWGMAILVGIVVTVLAAGALRSVSLASEVAELEAERARMEELARTLEEVEAAYTRLTALFAPSAENPGGLWLPPAGPAPTPGGSARAGEEVEGAIPPPSGWPLAERGFLTQPLVPDLETEVGGHPGIDLAVPSGSYFRSVGPGTVVSRGEDDLYGLFVVVEHPGGYRSLYAHASVVVVEPGRVVREGEVLGLTGSSGRSTAPHLHLEITRDGEHMDPLSVLVRP
jgi:murein DD-endopeptidase MepM/ murein hydrolase activator NlpD